MLYYLKALYKCPGFNYLLTYFILFQQITYVGTKETESNTAKHTSQ